MIEGSGSGSISLTNGFRCGSGRPKNIWILRIRIRNTEINVPHLAHVCRCVDVHDAGQMEEHDVTVRVEDGLYFRLAATSSSPVPQQEVRASGELVDVNTLKGENLISGG
jgi:hypothetical protein